MPKRQHPIITNHADRENWLACSILNNVFEGDAKQALVDLMDSTVPIDRNTRKAISAALQRDTGIRLQVVKAKGNANTLNDTLNTLEEAQTIGDEVLALEAEGKPRKAALSIVAERRGIGLTKVKQSLSHRLKTNMRVRSIPPADA